MTTIAGLEKRTFAVQNLKIETRAGEKGKMVRGYAAMFDKPSEDLGGFRETIKPGCFSRAIREKQDVRALVDHESSMVLGRSAAGTLRMTEDETGLAVEIDMPDTSYARDLAVSMERGDITQMSFGFRTVADRWGKQDGNVVRDLMDVDLFDVSVVTYPAYPDTAAAVRSMKAWEKREDGCTCECAACQDGKCVDCSCDGCAACKESECPGCQKRALTHPMEDPAVAKMMSEMGG